MAKKWGVIAVVSDKWRLQLPVCSALMNCRSIITMEMYSSQKLNRLDLAFASVLKTVSKDNVASMAFTTASQLCWIGSFSLKDHWHSWILVTKFFLSRLFTSVVYTNACQRRWKRASIQNLWARIAQLYNPPSMTTDVVPVPYMPDSIRRSSNPELYTSFREGTDYSKLCEISPCI